MIKRKLGVRKMVVASDGSVFGAAYVQLDRKIDTIERDFRADIATLSTKIETVNAASSAKIDRLGEQIFERIDRINTRPSGSSSSNGKGLVDSIPTWIATASGLIVLFGGLGSYALSNINSFQAANLERTTAAMAVIGKALEKETQDRTESDRRIYDFMSAGFAKEWSKDAQTEFERRIDEGAAKEEKFAAASLARIDKDMDSVKLYMSTAVVPRAEHLQEQELERDAKAHNEKQMGDSIDRVVQHLNQSDLRTEQKFTEIERVIHGYGIADEVKALRDDVQTTTGRMLNTIIGIVSGRGGDVASPNK